MPTSVFSLWIHMLKTQIRKLAVHIHWQFQILISKFICLNFPRRDQVKISQKKKNISADISCNSSLGAPGVRIAESTVRCKLHSTETFYTMHLSFKQHLEICKIHVSIWLKLGKTILHSSLFSSGWTVNHTLHSENFLHIHYTFTSVCFCQ